MYPPRFDYLSPSSIEEVLDLLEEHADDCKILAGGQSLIPVLKLRFASPDVLIDVGNIPELTGWRVEDGQLIIGAMTKHCDLADNEELMGILPVIPKAGHWVADPLVRNLGTLGGSMVHADPRGDWNSVMLALGATVVIRSTDETREVPITEFITGMFMTDVEPEELVTEIRIPLPDGDVGGDYIKLERRVGDYATAAAAIHLEVKGGVISRAGIGLTAVSPTNMKATGAEAVLLGQSPTADLFARAAEAAAAECSPEADIRGSAEYKRAVVKNYVQRGLESAWSQIQA